MDPQRFDNLARLLASGESRRSVFRKVLGGAVAALGVRSATGVAQECGVAGDVCGPGFPDCCGAHECLSGTCEPFQPQCGYEGTACIGDIDCCVGRCCDGGCHDNFVCCPTDFTSQAPECAWGETCDNNGTCVPMPCVPDQACSSDSDCCDGICCSGSCRSGATCCYEDGYTSPHCAIDEFCNDNGVCEYAPTCGEQGSGCALDQDCCTGICCDGVCESSFQCCPSDPGDPDPRCGDGYECAVGGICQPAPPCLEPGYICQDDGDCCEGSTCVLEGGVMICARPACVGEGDTCGGYVECCPGTGLFCSAETLTCVPEIVGPNVPTSRDQCRNGGWQTFTNPSFKNQGECIRFVNGGA